jgi:DNA-binding MarR family transcriptional regulator
MDTSNEKPDPAAEAMTDRFGSLSLKMLNDTPLAPAWRINFLANFFTGPIYREIGAQFGLTRPGFVILFSLSQQPGLVARDICLVTGLPKNSISRAVSELLERGLIRRKADTEDRRAKLLALTDEGRALLAKVVPLFEARQDAMGGALSPVESEMFDRLLMKPTVPACARHPTMLSACWPRNSATGCRPAPRSANSMATPPPGSRTSRPTRWPSRRQPRKSPRS